MMKWILFNLLCINSVLTVCRPPEPIVLVILIDVNIKERQLLEHILTNFVSSLADGSSVFINLIGDRIDEMWTSNTPIKDLDWMAKMQPFDMIQSGHTLSSSLIEDEINKRFSADNYKRRAELLLLFISEETKLDKVPAGIVKKKTLVVVVGTSIPAVYQDLASREDHFYLVGGGDHLINVTRSLVTQAICDSHYYCDTDQYSPDRGYRCRSCFNVCAKGQIKQPGTCTFRCPLFRAYEPKVTSTEATSTAEDFPAKSATEDHKMLILAFVGATFIIVLVIAIAAYRLYKYNVPTKTVATSSDSMESMPMKPMVQIHTSIPVQDTQGPGKPISPEEQRLFNDENDKEQFIGHGRIFNPIQDQ